MTRPSWVWSQRWHEVLFLHWRVDPAQLRTLVPAPLQIETFAGDAWVSLVLFRLRVRPLGLPFLPGLSDLVEVNLRTYVTGGGEPGIWFLSVHADNHWAMRLARLLTPMPYEHAALEYRRDARSYYLEARRGRETLASLAFCPAGSLAEPEEGSLDAWLLERYRLFARGRDDALMQAEVVHPRWVAQGAGVSMSANRFGDRVGLDLSRAADQAHFSPGVWARFGAFLPQLPAVLYNSAILRKSSLSERYSCW